MLGVFRIHLHTKLYVPNYNDSLVIIKERTKYIFHMALTKAAYPSKIYKHMNMI